MADLHRTHRRRFLGSSLLALGALPHTSLSAIVSQARPVAPSAVDDDAWQSVREHFTAGAGVAYLNNASMGMPPAAVGEAVAAGYRAISRDPVQAKHALQEQLRDVVLPGLARFLGCEVDELSLTRNATEALHLQALGLRLQPGDEVLISTQEHPAGRQPWLLRAARHGVRITEVFVPSPIPQAEDVVAAFTAAITPRTRALAFCHVTRGGHVYPVRALSDLAHDRGLACLVDGAQAVGMFPVDLHAVGCDAYSASLHKWFLGPLGTGFLYVRREARQHIESLFAHDASPEAPALGPPGTVDLPVRAALGAALSFVESIGIDNVAARARFLSDYLKTRLQEVPGATLLSGPTPATACPGSTIFQMAGVDPIALVAHLDTQSLYIDEHVRDGQDAVRVSTHVYNTTTQVDRLVSSLARLRG